MVRFSPVFDAIPIAPDLLVLVSERRMRLLRGVLLYEISRRINDRLTVDEISSDLDSAYPITAIQKTLKRLERYLETDVEGSDHGKVFWANVNDLHEAPNAPSTRSSVAIVSLVDVETKPLADSLAAAGYAINCKANASLVIVVTESYLHPDLERMNAEHLTSRVPWVLVKPVGGEVLIGPLFCPPGGPCWECMAHRLRLNRIFEGAIAAAAQRDPVAPMGYVASSLQTAYSLLAAELAKFLNGCRTVRIDGEILSLDLATMETRAHTVVCRHSCCVCKPTATATRMVNEFDLRSLRASAPAIQSDITLMNEYEHHVSPLTGIIRSLDAIPFGDEPDDLHLYSAGLTLGRRLNLRELLADSPENYAVGSGRTRDAARLAALLEGLERYSMAYDGTEPLVHGSLTSLGASAIHPNACMLFSDRQYSTGNAPLPYPSDENIAWVEGWSLVSDERRYLPATICFVGAEAVLGNQYCVSDSNGVAAGSSLKDAAVRAFLELIERDAASIWWFNQLPRLSIDVSKIDDEFCRNLVTTFDTRNRDVWMCEITSDMQVPCWAAISTARDGTDLWFGFSAAFSHRAAARQALFELCQRLPLPRTGTERKPNKLSLGRFPFVRSGVPQPLTSFSESFEPDADEFETCLRTAERSGVDFSVFNLTREDVGVPVVRAIAPGLRHLRPRFAVGRLYDVPVRLGLRKRPLAENQFTETGPVTDSRGGIL